VARLYSLVSTDDGSGMSGPPRAASITRCRQAVRPALVAIADPRGCGAVRRFGCNHEQNCTDSADRSHDPHAKHSTARTCTAPARAAVSGRCSHKGRRNHAVRRTHDRIYLSRVGAPSLSKSRNPLEQECLASSTRSRSGHCALNSKQAEDDASCADATVGLGRALLSRLTDACPGRPHRSSTRGASAAAIGEIT
jgi:hypothetical protein